MNISTEQYEKLREQQMGKLAIRQTREMQNDGVIEPRHNVKIRAEITRRYFHSKAEAKAEKEIHSLISQELRRREIRFLHADMRKKSTLPEGHPDYTIFLPKGRTVFAEIKTPEGKIAPHQAAYIAGLEADGFAVWVPRSFEEFRELLVGVLGSHEK